MGKTQKKTGKGRLDKFYHLAKEQGYRARSAFKLIQLNRKYDILSKSKVCIDLCAAPGGWCQVASKYMPVGSLIVGVDLDAIRPLPNVTTFVSDITTQDCRNKLRSTLKDWKADVVLHDGAPNVGTAWVHDAYSQSELVLMSLKLAVEFLKRGGTFVTKVFRSGDYQKLIWVFGMLFGKVEATKPPSSRNVSAEIFVVCRDFLAPATIDPRFLDPKHVFKDLQNTMQSDPVTGIKVATTGNAHSNVFAPEKKRRQREGYEDGATTLHREIPIRQFVESEDAVGVLGSVNKMSFVDEDEKSWLKFDFTTPEIVANCEDLKVLGKGDFKALMKWRIALREEIGLDAKSKDHLKKEVVEDVPEEEEKDEDEQIEEELERLQTTAQREARQARRKAQEKKMRLVVRQQLRMTAPTAEGIEMQDGALDGEDFFDLGIVERERGRKGLGADEGMEGSDEEEEQQQSEDEEEVYLNSEDEREAKTRGLENELDGLYDSYRERMNDKDSKFKVKESRLRDKSRESWAGIQEKGSDDEEDEDEAESDGGYDLKEARKAQIGEEPDSDESSDEDDDQPVAGPSTLKSNTKANSRNGGKLLTRLDAKEHTAEVSGRAKVWFEQDVFKSVDGMLDGFDDLEDEEEDDEDEDDEDEDDEEMDANSEDEEEEEEEVVPVKGSKKKQVVSSLKKNTTGDFESDSEDDYDGYEVVPAEKDIDDGGDMWDVDDEDQDAIKKARIQSRGLLTAEAMTLASQLVNREKTASQLMDDGFTKHAFDSKDDLPTWFLDDETKHYKSNVPITKEAVDALKAKQRALDARPIRKVAEAKARKQRRATIRMEKALKKADGIVNAEDVTERQKAGQVEKVMRKGTAKDTRKPIKIVAATGANRGIKGRPKGVKGRYKMLDNRDRKELRAKKRREKAAKPHGGRKKN